MNDILFMMVIPFIAACLMLLIRNDKTRSVVVSMFVALIMIASVVVAVNYLGKPQLFDLEIEHVGLLIFVVELILGLIIIGLGAKYRKWHVCILGIIQIALSAYFEFCIVEHAHVSHTMYIDDLSVLMILIIGIIGGLITLYAVGYMRDFQHHHSDQPDRRPWFFFLMFVFLSAMYGIVLSNDLVWMYFFWEITTLCSFALIGFTRTEEARNNSFRQLWMNLIGGIAFIIANILIADQYGILELNKLLLLNANETYVLLVVGLLAIAGMVKAAQMPFHTWLLGAMVAPTPTSALLHSSTMVKAGVFLLLKLSPLLHDNVAGVMVMSVGALTFLLASMAAISQTNAKRVLAYSTIANLGLIVACAGVGTAGAAWAGVMLLVFHAITKSLMFLCVGTVEHHIGSRDIEDMDGLFTRMPRLAMLMLIGIAGMFLAPLGMLISKWAALTSFVTTDNILLIMCIVFGSAVTSFYWTKWAGKLCGIIACRENCEQKLHRQEDVVLYALAALTLVVCAAFPLMSDAMVVPWLESAFGFVSESLITVLSTTNTAILLVMLVALVLLFVPFFGKTKRRIVPNYLSGVGVDNNTFIDSMGAPVDVGLRNWYMTDWFGEDRIRMIGEALCALVMVVGIICIMGGWFA